MLEILEQTIETVRRENKEYIKFEDSGLDIESRGRLSTFLTPKISGSTVRHAINSLIIDHHRAKNFCGGIHEIRGSKINLLDCPNTSHACLHGETTIMPAMLIGAFLIQQIEGTLSFNHPGILFYLMTEVDINAQRLFMRRIAGYDSTEAAMVTSDIPEERYRIIAQKAKE